MQFKCSFDSWREKTLYNDEVLLIFRSDYTYNIFIISCYLLFKKFKKKIKVDFFIFQTFKIILT